MPTRPNVFRYERMCNFGANKAFRRARPASVSRQPELRQGGVRFGLPELALPQGVDAAERAVELDEPPTVRQGPKVNRSETETIDHGSKGVLGR